jgi:hypothetical protein
MITMQKPHTVTEIAKRFDRTPGRIRQICREHGIGYLIQSDLRLLDDSDVKKIKAIIENDRRKKKMEST